jgi:hypothetical protein
VKKLLSVIMALFLLTGSVFAEEAEIASDEGQISDSQSFLPTDEPTVPTQAETQEQPDLLPEPENFAQAHESSVLEELKEPAELSNPTESEEPAEPSISEESEEQAESSGPEESEEQAESCDPEEFEEPAESSDPEESEEPVEESDPTETDECMEASAQEETGKADEEAMAPEEVDELDEQSGTEKVLMQEEQEDEEESDEEKTEEEEEQEPEERECLVRVSVPEGYGVSLNPYRLPVSMPDGTISYEQVMSSCLEITNDSDFPVEVYASAVSITVPGSGVVYVDSVPSEDSKEVFLWYEFAKNEGQQWCSAYSDAYNQLPVDSGERPVMRLSQAGDEGDTGEIKLFGLAGTAPQEMWTEADRVQVTLFLNFRPVIEAQITE